MSELTFNTKRFNELLKEKNLTVQSLSEIVKVNSSTVQKWTEGQTPYSAVIGSLCNALGCKKQELFSLDGKFDISEKPAEKAKPVKEEKFVEKTPTPMKQEDMPKPVSVDKPEKVEKTPIKKTEPAEKPKREVKKTESKGDILSAMKDTKFATKTITKEMDAGIAKVWTAGLIQSYKDEVGTMFDRLQNILNTSYPKAFGESAKADNKYTELLKAAEKSSDEGIKIAITILKKFSK